MVPPPRYSLGDTAKVVTQRQLYNVTQPFRPALLKQISGSALAINERQVVSNNHVAVSSKSVSIRVPRYGKRDIRMRTVAIAPNRDLSLIEVIDNDDIRLLPYHLGDSDTVLPQDRIRAIGYPLGSEYVKVTQGVISGFHHVPTADSVILTLQTDAAINPGNSGGPMVNERNEVVGINFAGARGADNISYAIPVNELKTFLKNIDYVRTRVASVSERRQVSGGENSMGTLVIHIPELGIQTNFSNDVQDNYLINGDDGNRATSVHGIYVKKVLEGSFAAAVDIREGDIVTRFNGYELDDFGETNVPWVKTNKVNLEDLYNRLGFGDTVTMTLIRRGRSSDSMRFEGRELTRRFQVTPRPPRSIRAFLSEYEPMQYVIVNGVIIMPLYRDHTNVPPLVAQNLLLLRYRLQQNQTSPQLIISYVVHDSLAQMHRILKAGMLIDTVNGERVRTLSELVQILMKTVTPGGHVAIRVQDSGDFDVLPVSKHLLSKDQSVLPPSATRLLLSQLIKQFEGVKIDLSSSNVSAGTVAPLYQIRSVYSKRTFGDAIPIRSEALVETGDVHIDAFQTGHRWSYDGGCGYVATIPKWSDAQRIGMASLTDYATALNLYDPSIEVVGNLPEERGEQRIVVFVLPRLKVLGRENGQEWQWAESETVQNPADEEMQSRSKRRVISDGATVARFATNAGGSRKFKEGSQDALIYRPLLPTEERVAILGLVRRSLRSLIPDIRHYACMSFGKSTEPHFFKASDLIMYMRRNNFEAGCPVCHSGHALNRIDDVKSEEDRIRTMQTSERRRQRRRRIERVSAIEDDDEDSIGVIEPYDTEAAVPVAIRHGMLSLSRRKLEVFPTRLENSIMLLSRVVTLNLKQNSIREFPRVDLLRKMPLLTNLLLSDNRLTEIGDLTPSIRVLDVSDNVIRDGLIIGVSVTRYLETLILNYNYIKTLEVVDIRTLPKAWFGNIKCLEAKYNNLDSVFVASDLFANRASVDFSHNKIILIPEFITQSGDLTSVNLSHNRISTLVRNPHMGLNLPELVTFDMSYNNIRGPLDLKLFNSMLQLRQLDLSHNAITRISLSTGVNSQGPLSQVSNLDFSNNKLSYVDLVQNGNNLTLDLSHNLLREFPAYLLKTSMDFGTRLGTLLLNDNLLGSIPDGVELLKSGPGYAIGHIGEGLTVLRVQNNLELRTLPSSLTNLNLREFVVDTLTLDEVSREIALRIQASIADTVMDENQRDMLYGGGLNFVDDNDTDDSEE